MGGFRLVWAGYSQSNFKASKNSLRLIDFGIAEHQYYETVCGGSGAGPDFDGTDAVHTHMTNSRMTDPEILEFRYPVVLEEFSVRRGTGGAGRHTGGAGVLRRIRFNEPMEVNISTTVSPSLCLPHRVSH
jgi:5-oxoprolinase (ATP-hydrolysing)